MGQSCPRCGNNAELYASTDGSMLCMACVEATKPYCVDCIKCHQKKCGDAIYACAFCHLGTEKDAERFISKAGVRLEPLRMDERCERCGATLTGRAFILHGKALCRDCLIYEQGEWEIVPAKPGKYGSRVKITIAWPIPGPGAAQPDAGRVETGRKLFRSIGVDPDNLPPDPFSGDRTLREGRMPDGKCANCEAYSSGKKRGKIRGRNPPGRQQLTAFRKATHLNSKGE
jgi:hypothetical protein